LSGYDINVYQCGKIVYVTGFMIITQYTDGIGVFGNFPRPENTVYAPTTTCNKVNYTGGQIVIDACDTKFLVSIPEELHDKTLVFNFSYITYE
jgi:hypothetical protein